MKIKGVQGGKNKGDPIELSAEEKAPLALRDAATAHADFAGLLVYCTDVVLHGIQVQTKGEKLKKLWQNNFYVASGQAKFNRRKAAGDAVLSPKVHQFELRFEDTLDSNGLPDLKTTALKLS